ncbi:cytosolic protein [Bacillus pumilus]|uniref:Cytosolic protein n=1 Tax=Bacillus pumilus TaxID=1408 RepID=A0AAD0MMD9_BACPU|nr:cytosolic protein [Bacillus pumilus]AVM24973.1 cytosolic protein [Bacillus pumilus]TYS36495.1 cytosolic protein [Bacillus pumilus]TYS42076.1 cytosolic protein [Bacillus pumilus]TYS53301.1 cytosolic protein [Bacillus pumilus]
MTLGQKFKRFMSNHTETSDEHPVSELKSHYYKSTNAQALQAVEAILSRNDSYQVTSVSAERGEISANIRMQKKAFLVATVISIRPFETAVDFNVTTETALPTDFGHSQKVVLSLYDELDKQLPRIDRS